MRRAALGAGLLALLAGVLAWWVPYATRQREYRASVPQPAPLTLPAAVVLLPPQQACSGPVTMTSDSGQARLEVGAIPRPGPPLAVTLAGPGYAARRAVAGGYAANTTLRIDVPPPPRDMAVRVCVANRGRTRVALRASAEVRTEMPFVTRVDGSPAGANPLLAFYERRPVTIVDKLPRIARSIGVLKPGIVGPWLLWALLAAVALGIPALVMWALGRALATDDHDVDRPRDVPPDADPPDEPRGRAVSAPAA